VGLLIALWGAAVLLSALVLLAGYRRRGQGPVEPAAPRSASRGSVGPLEGQGAAVTGNGWMFSGGA
jgi:hypothetical protein